MQAKDVFGIVLRIIGVICLVWAVLDATLAIYWATDPLWRGAPVTMEATRAVIYLVVGLLLLLGTKWVVRLAYEKEQ
ncbi:MAG: hypothetical protein P4L10_02110 [Acidobacteriaceae bacterium]|nr:hypothetical protein [Acidobacteriaceae bacterium]